MGTVTLVEVRPSGGFVDPCLDFVAQVDCDYDREAILSVRGELRSGEAILALATERPSRRSEQLSGRGRNGFNRQAQRVTLATPLSRRALDILIEARGANPEGDVRLELVVWVRTIKVGTHTLQELNIALPTQGGPQPVRGQIGGGSSLGGVGLLAVAQGGNLAEVEWAERTVSTEIPASRWAQVFAPAFGLGRSLLFEFPVPDTDRPQGVPEWLVRASEDLRSMEQQMEAGEWAGVVRKSREVAEVLRGRRGTDIARLLETDGVVEDAAAPLVAAMDGLFQYASKFVHALDKKQGLRPRMNVSKEDALLAMAAASATVNLLTAKVRRAARDAS